MTAVSTARVRSVCVDDAGTSPVTATLMHQVASEAITAASAGTGLPVFLSRRELGPAVAC